MKPAATIQCETEAKPNSGDHDHGTPPCVSGRDKADREGGAAQPDQEAADTQHRHKRGRDDPPSLGDEGCESLIELFGASYGFCSSFDIVISNVEIHVVEKILSAV